MGLKVADIIESRRVPVKVAIPTLTLAPTPLLRSYRNHLSPKPLIQGHYRWEIKLISRHVSSRQVTLRHVKSRYVTSRHVTSHHLPSRCVTPRHVTIRHVTSPHVTLRHVMSRHVTLCHVTSPHPMSHHLMSPHGDNVTSGDL